MHQTAPFSGKNSKNFLGRGCRTFLHWGGGYPSPDPNPFGAFGTLAPQITLSSAAYATE